MLTCIVINMSSLPINGYFKQLQDYCVAVAERSRTSAQANPGGDSSAADLASDSVSLSSDTVELSRPARPANAYSYLDTLTASDKQLVKAATGWDIDADPAGDTASPEAFEFVGRINLDRACGALEGDIDKPYIDKLVRESLTPQKGQATVPLSILYKAEAYFSQGTASR